MVEQAMLEDATALVPGTVQGLHELADIYLDFHLSHPHIARLWLHRWFASKLAVCRQLGLPLGHSLSPVPVFTSPPWRGARSPGPA
ncbi:hypothetical protein ACQEU6_24620 [Spirillospora sp. CA-108201]